MSVHSSVCGVLLHLPGWQVVLGVSEASFAPNTAGWCVEYNTPNTTDTVDGVSTTIKHTQYDRHHGWPVDYNQTHTIRQTSWMACRLQPNTPNTTDTIGGVSTTIKHTRYERHHGWPVDYNQTHPIKHTQCDRHHWWRVDYNKTHLIRQTPWMACRLL